MTITVANQINVKLVRADILAMENTFRMKDGGSIERRFKPVWDAPDAPECFVVYGGIYYISEALASVS